MEMKTYKILIVEDDRDTARMEALLLERMGFEVDCVYDGLGAISKMRAWKPEIVVLDLELPGKNGLQILMEMFLDQELRSVIIIANTVHMDAKDDLGFAFYAHYQRIKQEEPMMVNKLKTDGVQGFDLPVAVAEMMGKKYGHIPRGLADYLKKHYGEAVELHEEEGAN